MSIVKVEVGNLPEVYVLLEKLNKAGYSKDDFSWEYKNHIREFSFDSAPQEPRHVVFTFVDDAVACWFKLLT
jgi:hypothetical protein